MQEARAQDVASLTCLWVPFDRVYSLSLRRFIAPPALVHCRLRASTASLVCLLFARLVRAACSSAADQQEGVVKRSESCELLSEIRAAERVRESAHSRPAGLLVQGNPPAVGQTTMQTDDTLQLMIPRVLIQERNS